MNTLNVGSQTAVLNRYLVLLLDAATGDDDKIWVAVAVLAECEDEAAELATKFVEADCGDGYHPMVTWTESDLESLVTALRSAKICTARSVAYM